MKHGKVAVCVAVVLLLCCAGPKVRERYDSMGRVQKKEFYTENRLDHIEEIAYIGASKNPEKIIYLKNITGRLLPYHEKVLGYADGTLVKVTYFIYIGDSRVPSGKINYRYADSRMQRCEYHSVSDLNSRKLFLSALDVYSYNNEGGLASRRIIEYGFNNQSGSGVQLSQYVIGYQKNRVVSMDALILDKKSSGMVQIKETSRAIITEMVCNIERNINERAKGTGFLKKNGTL